MLALIEEDIRAFDLSLSGLRVVVPVDSRFLAATAATALMAGAAAVTAVTPTATRFQSAEEAAEATRTLVGAAGLLENLSIDERIDHETCRATNVLLNGPSIRPITRSLIERLPDHSVVALMHEAWMTLAGEVDIEACLEHDIPISAVNESHPLVGARDYHPALCLELLKDAEIPVEGADIALICDNPLSDTLEQGLRRAGAQVAVVAHANQIFEHDWRAILLAKRPREEPRLGIQDLGWIAKSAPDATVVQYWGDVDRKAARYFELKVWPQRTPGKGQWGIPLDTLGPGPILQRITGGLKAAQSVLAGMPTAPDSLAQTLTSTDILNGD
ncbi:hypothetical protein KUG85_09440 [Nitratireductor sp. L1-7-SE]|uniref:Uncharacterized protein n=1 Tax=Nitratireductor rhodophyticola TaxID=2854036 RepID=A0ABS7RBF2_9HYPH|nr:hypothetical protein [Nitratireductor rhodophyticola]MBY8918270.1 hypothetical protein [Nitratireductor rhodophyticola]MBY8920921.1 hypothetical protein [Nitratireductor rhodophyticola]